MNGNTHIRVAVRTRPLLPRDYQRIKEDENDLTTAVTVIPENNSLVISEATSSKPTHQFFFDRVFTPEENNEEVYDVVAKHIVQHVMRGYNGTIFAYGQTSTGKTHTVFGHSEDSPGIVPLAIDDVFDQIDAVGKSRVFFVRISVMEIYNERLTDLADFSIPRNHSSKNNVQKKQKSLRLRQAKNGFIFVENLVEEVCTNREDAQYFLHSCLTKRHMAQTLANKDSSRSHVICRIVVESRQVAPSGRTSSLKEVEDEEVFDYDQAPTIVGELNFVDLAGAECATNLNTKDQPIRGSIGADRLPSETAIRLKEGSAINRSLLMLGIVISQLSESKPIIHYRNSKLTRILQNALGGNSLTAIICTVSPTDADKRQTINTLQFANNAKSIKNKPRLNETYSPDQAVLRRLQLEIERLRRRIAELEMQQSFSSSQVSSTTSERRHLHENERLLLQMIAGGRYVRNTPLAAPIASSKPPLLSRRMTWAPTASGHAVLMFTDNNERPESASQEVSNSQVSHSAEQPVVFRGMLDSQDFDDSRISQASSALKSTSVDESIHDTIERIENDNEFQTRFVGRQYFDIIARNYEKLKFVLVQHLGIPVKEDDDFSDISDKISSLVARSRDNTYTNSPGPASRKESLASVNSNEFKMFPNSLPPAKRNVMSAKLPPLVINASLLVRAKTINGTEKGDENSSTLFRSSSDLRLVRSSTTLLNEIGSKRPALVLEEDDEIDRGHGIVPESSSEIDESSGIKEFRGGKSNDDGGKDGKERTFVNINENAMTDS